MNSTTNPDGPDLKHVTIYTDGGCQGNPGPGGYGTVMLFGDKRRELSAGYKRTTNNRMELMAAIAGLETLRYACNVTIYTDSQYLANGINLGWAKRWKSKGWMRTKDEKAVNPDLWDRLLGLCEMHHVNFVWVRGHAGNVENERCDVLSVAASKGPDFIVDEGYKG